MPSTGIRDVSLETRQPQLATLGWAVRRAALGLLILLTVAGLSAWLLYVSIEPDGASPGSDSEYAIPQQ